MSGAGGHPPPHDPFGAFVTLVDRPPQPGPLAGLRTGVKDLIAVAGVPRLCGAPAVVDATPQEQDATAVARLVAAGAHIVATTATHEFGWGVTTPATRNPRALDRVAGGSSGGSAAAVAAGLVDAALGTDTAGSIRIPAACCGVVGLRPTEGLVPRKGVQPLAPTLDVVGPLARDVATTKTLFEVLSGARVQEAPPQRLRIGIVKQIEASPIDVEIRAVVDRTLEALRDDGATVASISLTNLHRAREATMTVLAAEEYGIHQPTLEQHGSMLSDNVVAALEASRALTVETVLEARRDIAMFRDSLGGVFADVDVLVLPALPCVVPRTGERTVVVQGRAERTSAALIRLCAPWSGAGVPAGVVPAGRDSDDAPVGVQVVGRWRDEASVLSVLAAIERNAGGPWPAAS